MTTRLEASQGQRLTSPKVAFLDLTRQYFSMKKEIDNAVTRVLERGNCIGGGDVESFEKEFGSYLGVKNVVTVGSGTDALELSVRAIGIDELKRCVAPDNTFFAIASVVESCRGKLRLTDIETATFNMDPTVLSKEIANKAAVIVPAHAYGQMADMDSIIELGERDACRVVEDAAQACGARYRRKSAGTFGDVACFSFFPSKNLGAYGDGGAVATDDSELAERVRMLRNYGQGQRYVHVSFGRNSRLDAIQAAVLRVKLKRLDLWNRKRQEHAALYEEHLQSIEEVVVPTVAEGRDHVFSLYVIRCAKRNHLKAFLEHEGISTEINYPIPLHQQPACKHLGYRDGSFPKSEQVAREILSLPMYPELTNNEIVYVCEKIQDFYKGSRI